jgi:hypothetical protein
MKYLFDNCISPKCAKMLSALGVEVEALIDRFEANTPDVDIFRQLKDSYVVFVSADRKQQTREREYLALKEAGLTAIWFGPFWNKKKFWDQAVWLIRRWESIRKFTETTVQGTCAEIKENGKAHPFTL